jgi:hypothetical protein
MNGMTVKSEMGMNPEQILFSEASGSTRGLSQEAQSLSNLSRLNTSLQNKSWQTMTSSKVTPAPQQQQPKGSGGSSLLSYTSPQMGGLLGQDFGLMPETSQVNLAAMAASQQQHSFLSNGYGGVEATRESSEGQPLRHFFDDWPRSRADPSALAWGSDVEDSDRATSNPGAGAATTTTRQSNHNNNNTQLSISIPNMATAPSSGDFNSQSSGGSPSRGKLSLSPLKLSMSRAGDDDEDRAWAWEPTVSVGGPLAEVLQSGQTGGSNASGLNLLSDDWLDHHHKKSSSSSSSQSPGHGVASPVDVLHKSTFSDSSTSTSSASSPRGAVPVPGPAQLTI